MLVECGWRRGATNALTTFRGRQKRNCQNDYSRSIIQQKRDPKQAKGLHRRDLVYPYDGAVFRLRLWSCFNQGL